MAVDAGTIYASFDLDTSGFDGGMSHAASSLLNFTGSGTVGQIGVLDTAIGKIGATMAGLKIGEKLVEIGQNVVRTGMDFDSQMSRVQAISGATQEEFEQLRQTAMDLGASTVFSGMEAAEGMENLASAGFDTREIIAAMPGMLDLAASSGESLAASAAISASTLRGFGLEADRAGHVADVLAANAAKTNASVADTGEAMKYVAPIAHAMGLGLEEVTAAIGIMSDAGIVGSQAGTTLRGALSRLAKPTEDMSEVMQSLGLDFYDAGGNMKSLESIVGMLDTKMAGLTNEQRQNALVTLFGQEALSGMMVLMEAGPEKLSALAAAYENCDGAAAEMAQTMTDNLGGDVEALGGALETAAQSVYDRFEPAMRTGVQAVTGLVDAFNEDGLSGVWDHVVTAAQNVDWAAIGTSIQTGVTGAFDAAGSWLSTHFEAARTAVQNTDWAALGASIHDGAVEKLDAAGAWLKSAFEAGKTAVGNIQWGEVGASILSGIGSVLDSAGAFLSNLFGFGKTAAEGMPWGEVGTAIKSGVETVLDTAGSWLSTGFDAAKTFIGGMPWGEVGTAIKGGVETVLDAAGNWLSSGFRAAKTAISGIDWSSVGSTISSGISGAIDGLARLGGSIWDTITGWFGGDDEEDAKGDAKSSGKSLTDGLESGITEGSAAVTTAANTAASAALGAAAGTLSSEAGSTVTTTWMDGLSTGITGAQETLSTDAQTAADSAAMAVDTVLSAPNGTTTGTVFMAGISSGFTTGSPTLSGNATTVASAASYAASRELSFSTGNGIGMNMVLGMAAGVRSGSSALNSAIRSVARSAVAAARSSLKINSPSGVFADEVGAWIPGGVGMGVMRHMQDAIGPIEEMRDGMVSMMDGTLSGDRLGMPDAPWNPKPFAGGGPTTVNINVTGDWTVRSEQDKQDIIDEIYQRIDEERRRR